MINLFLVADGIVMGFCAFMLWRNRSVHEFRLRLLVEISEIYRPEIYFPLIKEFESVAYADMVWLFWRPLSKFYSPAMLNLINNERAKN